MTNQFTGMAFAIPFFKRWQNKSYKKPPNNSGGPTALFMHRKKNLSTYEGYRSFSGNHPVIHRYGFQLSDVNGGRLVHTRQFTIPAVVDR